MNGLRMKKSHPTPPSHAAMLVCGKPARDHVHVAAILTQVGQFDCSVEVKIRGRGHETYCAFHLAAPKEMAGDIWIIEGSWRSR